MTRRTWATSGRRSAAGSAGRTAEGWDRAVARAAEEYQMVSARYGVAAAPAILQLAAVLWAEESRRAAAEIDGVD